MLNITVVQPPYFAGEKSDEKIADFLLDKLNSVTEGGLVLLPEYSNADGLSDAQSELKALPRAQMMLMEAAKFA